MEFKSMVNKESFKSILHHHFKNQVRVRFGSTILKDLQKLNENESMLPEDVIDFVGNTISQSDESKEFVKEFLNSLNVLFKDKDNFIPKEENQGTVSQCSSASSINTSIDYVSFDQFQDIINVLSNGINAEKLEALETFSRLPSLEHITKKTLWPSVENGLHSALLSNVYFLKDASLQIYMKMLSSSEPKVVQEGFNSLTKHVIHNLMPSFDQNTDDFISKCKLVVEIIAVLNRFLQSIPNHWLRYPQPIIEDITVQSVSILFHGSCSSNIFPMWLCIALCDKKSKWFKALLYGYVSRRFLLDALQKNLEIIKFALQICEKFNLEDNLNKSCCQRFADICEITHIICFLSYLLQHIQCRKIFELIYVNESSAWLNVLNLVIKCSQKLCSMSCLKCCSTVLDVVPKVCCNVWSCDNVSAYCTFSIKILQCFDNIQNLSENDLIFTVYFLTHSVNYLTNLDSDDELWEKYIDYLCILYEHLTNFCYNFPDETTVGLLKLFSSSLIFTKKILSRPSYLFISLTFLDCFSSWCAKIKSISNILLSSYSPGTKCNFIKETEQTIFIMFVSMLQRHIGILISKNLELFDTSVNVLLENMLQDIKVKNSICSRDVGILSSVLQSDYLLTSVLTKTIIFKLSSVVWLLNTGELKNLETVRNLLSTLIPSIFPDIFETEVIDNDCDSYETLFHCLTLCPSFIKEEFVFLEEYQILAFQVLSTLSWSVLSSCYLEAKFKLSNKLFDLLSYYYYEKDEPIIDPVSVIQNHLLVKLYTIGGSEERILPPETLLGNNEEYNYPFFRSYPVPHVYYKELSITGATDTDITFELNGENLKDIFLEYIEDDLLTIDVIGQILKTSINILEPISTLSETLNCISLEDIDDTFLQEEIICGFEMVKRYGKVLNLMAYEDDEILEKLLKAGKVLLNSENRHQLDIFICTLCLIFRCDIQASWIFLETFAKSSCSLFIWYERIFQALQLNEKSISTFDVILEYCDIIVKKTLPLVHSALQFSGILPSTLFKYWTVQCYWNYLNFTEIAQFVLISVIFGGDYAIYFFVSILKHMQNIILKNAHSSNLINVIKTNPIKDYKIKNFIHFIIELANIFQSKISKSVVDTLEE